MSLADPRPSNRLVPLVEMLEVATTFFEIGIVFVSISALSRTRILLYGASVTTLIGIGFLIFGLLPAH